MNEILRRVIAEAGLTEQDVASRLGVDPKTVSRWLEGRRPYPRNRADLARLVGVDAGEIWRVKVPVTSSSQPASVEIEAAYAHRSAVPQAVWRWLFKQADQEIGILAYAGLFLAEDVEILRILEKKAREGVTVRILLGDPDSPHVAKRGADEGVDDAMAARIRNVLVLYQQLRKVEGVEFRLHETILYASIYRADDDLLINPHAYGVTASHAPVLHVRQVEPGDMASVYAESFERVWRPARALT